MKLRFQICIAHRARNAANAVFYRFLERAPILERHRNVHLILMYASFDNGIDTIAQRNHTRVAHNGIAVRRLTALAQQDRRRAGMVDAELALQPCRGRSSAGEFQHQRMHFQSDSGTPTARCGIRFQHPG